MSAVRELRQIEKAEADAFSCERWMRDNDRGVSHFPRHILARDRRGWIVIDQGEEAAELAQRFVENDCHSIGGRRWHEVGNTLALGGVHERTSDVEGRGRAG